MRPPINTDDSVSRFYLNLDIFLIGSFETILFSPIKQDMKYLHNKLYVKLLHLKLTALVPFQLTNYM